MMTKRKRYIFLAILLLALPLILAQMLVSKKDPLAKPLMILSPRKFAGHPKKLVDWLVSPRGQAIVKSVGLVPVGEVAADFDLKPKPPQPKSAKTEPVETSKAAK